MPSSVIQQILNSLWQSGLNNPASPYYLPTLVTKAGFAPHYPAGNWAVGAIPGSIGTTAAGAICAATAPAGQSGIPTAGALPDVQLSNIVINNLQNVSMPAAPVSSGQYGFTITGTLVFTNISISGNFVLSQQCCVTQDQQTCLPNTTSTQTGSGTFTIAIAGQTTATLVTHISAMAPNVLTIVVDSITCSLGGATPQTTVDITSLPPSVRAPWDAVADKALNSPQVSSAMAAAVNAALNAPATRQEIGQHLTALINGHLQSTHQYPFDSSFRSVFS